MTISAKNKEVINTKDVYIHDDVLAKIDSDIVSKTICLTLRSWGKEQCYTITFRDCLFFNLLWLLGFRRVGLGL